MRAFFKLYFAGLILAAAMPAMAAPVTVDFENGTATNNGLTISGHLALGSFSVGSPLSSGNPVRKAALMTFYPDPDLDAQCPVLCTILGTYAGDAGFSAFSFDMAIYDGMAGTPSLEIFGDSGKSLGKPSVAGFDPGTNYCIDGKCTSFQRFSFERANGDEAWHSFKLTFSQAGALLFDRFSVTPVAAAPSPVPEPTGAALVAAAFGAAAWARRRTRR